MRFEPSKDLCYTLRYLKILLQVLFLFHIFLIVFVLNMNLPAEEYQYLAADFLLNFQIVWIFCRGLESLRCRIIVCRPLLSKKNKNHC